MKQDAKASSDEYRHTYSRVEVGLIRRAARSAGLQAAYEIMRAGNCRNYVNTAHIKGCRIMWNQTVRPPCAEQWNNCPLFTKPLGVSEETEKP